MKTIPISSKYAYVVLGVTMLQMLCAPNAKAASQPVTVTNGVANPVPVTIRGKGQVVGTVAITNIPKVTVTNTKASPVQVQGTINMGVNPYQHQASIGDSSTCAPQCSFSFPAVPQGQRLVITYVSAQLGSTIDPLVLEGGGISLFVPKAYQNASYLGAQVTYYLNPGATPTARVFQPNTAAHTSLIVDIVGYLVPVK